MQLDRELGAASHGGSRGNQISQIKAEAKQKLKKKKIKVTCGGERGQSSSGWWDAVTCHVSWKGDPYNKFPFQLIKFARCYFHLQQPWAERGSNFYADFLIRLISGSNEAM